MTRRPQVFWAWRYENGEHNPTLLIHPNEPKYRLSSKGRWVKVEVVEVRPRRRRRRGRRSAKK